MDTDDLSLLRAYAYEGSETAFAELVRRYLDLVYSAALRQLRSPHLAEEVAQSVFLDLSRSASCIKPGTPLVAWLCTVTRRTAIDVIRQESRRSLREQDALEVVAMKSSSSVWSQVEPVLDEAIESLKESDRTALLLRYFENKSLREVGQRLGLSEDAAQKKVSRALDHLRGMFQKRGIVVTAAALATDLSACAVQSSPSSLTVTISAASSLSQVAASKAAALEAARTVTLSTFQKTVLVVTAAAAVSLGLYQAIELIRVRDALRGTQNQLGARDQELVRLKHGTDEVIARTAAGEQQRDVLRLEEKRNEPDATLLGEMRAWYMRAERLKQLTTERPELTIPEFQLLNNDTWFTLAKDVQLDTEEHIRDALAALRKKAENVFAEKLSHALAGYVEGNEGALPHHLAEVAPFFDTPVDAAIFNRYELSHSGNYSDVPSTDRMSLVSSKAPVDVERDAYWRVGINSLVFSDFIYSDVAEARSAFSKANGGRAATNPAEWAPFLRWPLSEASLEKRFGKRSK